MNNNFTSINKYQIIPYIERVGIQLPRFKKTGDEVWNFRCVECGDSKRDPSKKRGFIFWDSSSHSFFYKCHKCGYSLGFIPWLSRFDNSLYKEFLIESIKSQVEDETPIEAKKVDDKLSSIHAKPDFTRKTYPTSSTGNDAININTNVTIDLVADSQSHDSNESVKIEVDSDTEIDQLFIGYQDNIFDGVRSIADLDVNHGARRYVADRMIPEKFFDKLYIIMNFAEWVNTWKPDKFNWWQVKNSEPRLIIPFYNKHNQVYMVQGRAFKMQEKTIRYLSIKRNDNSPKIYGLERLDPTRQSFVLEGPLDSLFIDNAIAMAGADVSNLEAHTNDNHVMVYDNEPRSREIVRRMYNDIENDIPIVIWPSSIAQKDVNDMILKGGHTKESINDIVNNSIYRGMAARMKLSEWSKVNINNNKRNRK